MLPQNLRFYSKLFNMASTGIKIPSLCIPRVYFQFDENYIEQVFLSIFGGTEVEDGCFQTCVERIDLVPREDRKTGEPFNIVFIHFNGSVADTPETTAFVEKIEANEEVKLMYRHPWFWKVRKNHTKSHEPRRTVGPRMILSAEDEAEVIKHQKEYYARKQTPSATPIPPSTPPPPTQHIEQEQKSEEEV